MPLSLYYSAGELHPLATLAVDTIDHIVSDFRINSSEREHYVIGCMGAYSVVIIHHYKPVAELETFIFCQTIDNKRALT